MTVTAENMWNENEEDDAPVAPKEEDPMGNGDEQVKEEGAMDAPPDDGIKREEAAVGVPPDHSSDQPISQEPTEDTVALLPPADPASEEGKEGEGNPGQQQLPHLMQQQPGAQPHAPPGHYYPPYPPPQPGGEPGTPGAPQYPPRYDHTQPPPNPAAYPPSNYPPPPGYYMPPPHYGYPPYQYPGYYPPHGYYPPPQHDPRYQHDPSSPEYARTPGGPSDKGGPDASPPGTSNSNGMDEHSDPMEDDDGDQNSVSARLKTYIKPRIPSTQEVLDRRSRKNAQSRARAAKLRQRIAEIELKPEEERTDEEAQLWGQYEQRRQRKNDRSRERALEKKEEIDRILGKPDKKRTKIERQFLDTALSAKKRKNEGDRLRRQRLKELGLSTKGTGVKPGISARGPLPAQYHGGGVAPPHHMPQHPYPPHMGGAEMPMSPQHYPPHHHPHMQPPPGYGSPYPYSPPRSIHPSQQQHTPGRGQPPPPHMMYMSPQHPGQQQHPYDPNTPHRGGAPPEQQPQQDVGGDETATSDADKDKEDKGENV